MQIINRVAASLLALSIPSMAQASDWMLIGESGNSALFIDRESIQHRGGTLYAWTYYIADAPNSDGVQELKSYKRYSCSEGSVQTVSVSIFDAYGRYIDSSDTVGPVSYPPPDSLSESSFLYVCKNRSHGKSIEGYSPREYADRFLKGR